MRRGGVSSGSLGLRVWRIHGVGRVSVGGVTWGVTRGRERGEWGIRMLGAGTCRGYVGRGRGGCVGGYVGVRGCIWGVRTESGTCVRGILGWVSGVGGGG